MAAAEGLPRQPETASIDNRVVKALSHPTRVQILTLLRDREMVSPVELSNELGLALGTVGYHVRRLDELGFIELAKRTQRRGAVEHHYRARTMLEPPLRSSGRAAKGRPARRGADACAAAHEAQAAVARGGFDAVMARSDARVLTLDEPGREQVRTALEQLSATIALVEQASAERLAAAGEAARPHACVAVAMLFDVEADDAAS